MNQKSTATFSPNLVVLFLGLTALQACVSTNTGRGKSPKSEWVINKVDNTETPEWIIYSREIPGTKFLEFKIEGLIEASPAACLNAFREDMYHQANLLENKEYPTYEIVEASSETMLTYVVYNESFPFKNTEMSVRYRFYEEMDGSLGVNWKEAWEESSVPPSKKLSRVQSFRGSWDFKPTPAGPTKATNTVKFDPKKMPMWLVRPMVSKFLKNGLKDLRALSTQT